MQLTKKVSVFAVVALTASVAFAAAFKATVIVPEDAIDTLIDLVDTDDLVDADGDGTVKIVIKKNGKLSLALRAKVDNPENVKFNSNKFDVDLAGELEFAINDELGDDVVTINRAKVTLRRSNLKGSARGEVEDTQILL